MFVKFQSLALLLCSYCFIAAATESTALAAGTTSKPATMKEANNLPSKQAAAMRVPVHQGNPDDFKKLDSAVIDGASWFRYFRAGEDAQLKKNESLAKQYWLQSLCELEKVNSHVTDDLDELVKISALEQNLTNAYPTDWSKLDSPEDDVMKLRREQVSILYRIALLNDRWVPKGNLLLAKSKERYLLARRDYEKAVSATR